MLGAGLVELKPNNILLAWVRAGFARAPKKPRLRVIVGYAPSLKAISITCGFVSVAYSRS